MILRFHKENDKWYVDLPEYLKAGGSKDGLEMIFGADEFLSDHCVIGHDNVMIEIATDAYDDNYDIRMKELIKSSNNLTSGAFYTVKCYNNTPTHVMWLCDVMTFVFGQFPKTIYYRIL